MAQEGNYSHTSFYAERVAPIVNDILLAVITLGITLIGFQYSRALFSAYQHDVLATVLNVDLLQRVCLLAIVFMFVLYDTLCYKLQLELFSRDSNVGRYFYSYGRSTDPKPYAMRIVLLLVADTLQAAVCVGMFVALALPDIRSTAPDAAAVSDAFAMDLRVVIGLWWMMLLWEIILLGWYFVWAHDRRFSAMHALGAAFALAMTLALLSVQFRFSEHTLPYRVSEWAGIIVLALMVLRFYRTGFIPMIQRHYSGLYTQQDISVTAFLVAESRRRLPDVSKDPFADSWIPPDREPEVQGRWRDYAEKVYPHDDLVVSLRNRWFLERLRERITKPNQVFVNLGAGLSSYPYVLDTACQCIEVDMPEIVAYKRERMRKLYDAGKLPRRSVEYVGLDFTSPSDLRQLRRLLCESLAGKESFVAMEGLIYYLDEPSMLRLFTMLADCMEPGSFVGLSFWEPSLRDNSVFNRQTDYFQNELRFDADRYRLLTGEDLSQLAGFQVEEICSFMEQQDLFLGKREIDDPDRVLIEPTALLKRV